jgi:rod shape-determining protein MreD
MAIWSAKPDFLLITVVLLSLSRSIDSGAGIGFAAGVIQGALTNTAMAAYTVSRTIAGATSARFAASSVVAAYPAVLAMAAVATLVAGIVFVLFGTEKNILRWLTATIGAALYNAVAAVALYWAYRAIARPSDNR